MNYYKLLENIHMDEYKFLTLQNTAMISSLLLFIYLGKYMLNKCCVKKNVTMDKQCDQKCEKKYDMLREIKLSDIYEADWVSETDDEDYVDNSDEKTNEIKMTN